MRGFRRLLFASSPFPYVPPRGVGTEPYPRAKEFLILRVWLFVPGSVALVAGLVWGVDPAPLFRTISASIGIVLIFSALWRPGFRRFGLWFLVAAIAFIAIILGALRMAIRHDWSWDLAQQHRLRAATLRDMRVFWGAKPGVFRIVGALGEPLNVCTRDEADALMNWHFRLVEKYEKAAKRPWATIPPDEPPPADETTDRSKLQPSAARSVR